MKTLILGKGEVGSALKIVLDNYHEVYIRDIDPLDLKDAEIMHVCFPYSDKFVEYVKSYKEEYKPRLTIINSSIEVGTTEQCGDHVVYSPIRGRHRPSLAAELKIFPKWIAGYNDEDTKLANDYFSEARWDCQITGDVKGMELCKLVSNVHMGLEVAWAQEMERLFKKMGGSMDTYKRWETGYQLGYARLQQFQLGRPIMKSDPIGGHCILECTEILQKQFYSLAFEFIKTSNDIKKGEVNAEVSRG